MKDPVFTFFALALAAAAALTLAGLIGAEISIRKEEREFQRRLYTPLANPGKPTR